MSDNDIVARLREAMKAKARELPYMSDDVEFFGVTDAEWNELIGVVIAPLRADLAAARALLKEALMSRRPVGAGDGETYVVARLSGALLARIDSFLKGDASE